MLPAHAKRLALVMGKGILTGLIMMAVNAMIQAQKGLKASFFN